MIAEISERKKFLLDTLVREYVKTAQPVSSGVLVSKYKLDISPATVRNEMMELEDQGYIYQPHTSAGRVPTEAAYKLLLAELQAARSPKELKESEWKNLNQLFRPEEAAYKQVAKAIAELSNNAVFWAFHKNDLYYTGLTNLFAQPEFRAGVGVCDVSAVIDRLEEIIDSVFENIDDGRQVLIGESNPFRPLSAVLVKYRNPDNKTNGVFGILGPLRMDYGRNLALAEFINKKFV